MLHNQSLNKENIQLLFQTFAKEYESLGGKEDLNLYLVGGAAILFNFNYRKSTIDIDALFKNTKIVEEAIKNTAQIMNLTDDWLNQDFKDTPSFSPKIVEKAKLFKEYGNTVKVFLLEPKYIISMKLKSSRPTGGDLDDIIKMIYELRIKGDKLTFDETMKAYDELYQDHSNTYESFFRKTKEAFDTPIEDFEYLFK